MSHSFVDCQGLAGAWSLGAVQAGLHMKHRVSLPGAFGDAVVEHNRDLLRTEDHPGHFLADFEVETGDPHGSWTPQVDVGALFGTPPCSGFSLLNKSKKENARGPDSNINQCMKELVEYAGRCTGEDGLHGPEIVSLESVQGAYTLGRGLMQELRDILERITGERYALTHVLMSGASVGAAQFRHRYFPVWHRIPFGVETPQEKPVTTYRDAIGDLERQPIDVDRRAYRFKGRLSDFQTAARSGSSGVDWHAPEEKERIVSMIKGVCASGWPEGYNLVEACLANGCRPAPIQKAWVEEEGKYRGWRWPSRIKADRCGYVLTGNAAAEYIHYSQPRLLTIRECTRLMGYPDRWQWPVTRTNQAGALIGKCCPVNSGQWIAGWFIRALDGDIPGVQGFVMNPFNESIGENEYLHNSTPAYKDWPNGRVPSKEKPLHD